jgi:hypothetical protein
MNRGRMTDAALPLTPADHRRISDAVDELTVRIARQICAGNPHPSEREVRLAVLAAAHLLCGEATPTGITPRTPRPGRVPTMPRSVPSSGSAVRVLVGGGLGWPSSAVTQSRSDRGQGQVTAT